LFLLKQQKTEYQLESHEVTVTSIKLADELNILLIFVNNDIF